MNVRGAAAPGPPALAAEGQDPARAHLRHAVLRRRVGAARTHLRTGRQQSSRSPAGGHDGRQPGTERPQGEFSVQGVRDLKQERQPASARCGPTGPASLRPACKQRRGGLRRRHRRGLQAQRRDALRNLLVFSLARPRRHDGRVGWPWLVHVRPRAAPGAGDHRDRPPGVRAAPRRAAGADRGDGRAQGTGRHVRRHARTPRRVVRRPAPVRRQRLARAAHAADRDAHGDRRDPGQAVADRAAAHGMAVRVRRSIDRAEAMVEALLTLAVSDQGKLSTEFSDLATWAEDAIDAAAPEIERLDLHVDADAWPGRDHRGPAAARADDLEPGRQRRPAQRARRLDQAAHRQQRRRRVPRDRQQRAVRPRRAVPSLFEPFRRMETRTGVRDGVGLGLSIARSVVTAHRATVTARSQPDGGLDISVMIPRDRAAARGPLLSLEAALDGQVNGGVDGHDAERRKQP